MRKCVICHKQTYHKDSPYCLPCKTLIKKGRIKKIKVKVLKKALKNAWKGDGFHCHYCDIRLDGSSSKSPKAITFDHVIPRQNNKIVITAAIINDMKSDMSKEEFRKMVIELANRFRGGDFDGGVFNLKHYKR